MCSIACVRMMHTKCVCYVVLQVSSAEGECKKSEAEDTGCVFYHMCQACQDDLRCVWNKASCRPRTKAGEITKQKSEHFCLCGGGVRGGGCVLSQSKFAEHNLMLKN